MLMLLGGTVVAQARGSDEDGGNSNGWLGIYSQTLTTELRDGLDYKGAGVLVNRVVAGSPAEKAGLEKGDVIVSVNGHQVDSPDQLAEVIGGRHAGDDVSVRIVRNGERQTLSATLASRDDADETSPGTKVLKHFDKDNDGPGEPGNVDDDQDVPAPPDAPEAPEAPSVPNRVEIHRMMHNGDGMMKMKMFGLPGRGRLGVQIQDLDSGSRGDYGVDQGALVTQVLDDTPARRGGIRDGDVITSVDDQKVSNASDLIEALRGKSGSVKIDLVRGGDRRTVTVQLEPATNGGPMGGPQMFDFHGDNLMRHDLGAPAAPGAPGSLQERDELRKEIAQLRQELRQLRRELNDMKRDSNR